MHDEVLEFLERLRSQYDPDEGYHDQMKKMLTQLCNPSFTRDYVRERMRWAEREYKFESEQRERMNEIESLCSQLGEAEETEDIREISDSISQKFDELNRLTSSPPAPSPP